MEAKKYPGTETGVYQVQVTVYDSNGAPITTKIRNVTLLPPPPDE